MAADQCSVVVASVVSLDPAKERRGEDSQSLDTKLKLMAHIKLEMEALMAQIKTKTHTIQQYNTISDSGIVMEYKHESHIQSDKASIHYLMNMCVHSFELPRDENELVVAGSQCVWQVSNIIVIVYH